MITQSALRFRNGCTCYHVIGLYLACHHKSDWHAKGQTRPFSAITACSLQAFIMKSCSARKSTNPLQPSDAVAVNMHQSSLHAPEHMHASTSMHNLEGQAAIAH